MKTRILLEHLRTRLVLGDEYPEYDFPPRERTRKIIKRRAENLRRMCKRHGIKWKIITTDRGILINRL